MKLRSAELAGCQALTADPIPNLSSAAWASTVPPPRQFHKRSQESEGDTLGHQDALCGGATRHHAASLQDIPSPIVAW